MTRKTLYLAPLGTFCVDGIQTNPDGSFTGINPTAGACGVEPPPGPDLTALSTARVTWFGNPQTVLPNCDMRNADAFLGRLFATGAPVAFPWAGGTCGLLVPAGKKIRARFTVPANVTQASRLIRLNNYHGATPIPARMAIVAPDADWPADSAQQDGSYRRHVIPGGNLALQVACGYADSTGRAEVMRGQSYDFLFAFEDGADADANPDGGFVCFG